MKRLKRRYNHHKASKHLAKRLKRRNNHQQIEQAPSTQADGITPPQDTLKQAQEQYGYIPGYGGVPADSPEVAREQAENEARQRWHDGQVEWGIQQGYLNPDGSPKETN